VWVLQGEEEWGRRLVRETQRPLLLPVRDRSMMAASGGGAGAVPALSSADVAAATPRKLPAKPRASKSPAKSKRGPTAAGKKGGDGKQFSCHYCRQKRADIVDCPQHVEGHRWCGSCIRNHLGLDIEEIRANPTKFWPDGCAVAPRLSRPSLMTAPFPPGPNDLLARVDLQLSALHQELHLLPLPRKCRRQAEGRVRRA
jgi:hypothetical protein